MQSDTIAAIATPPGVGGIGIVRVSGEAAFSIVLPLFRRPGGEQALPPSHQLTYGRIVDPRSGEVLDEVLVAFMRRPHTYTREDVVEIQGHGGPLVLQRILRLVLEQGARLAQPGEFTLRAFLNGRLDLAQAEAVMDVISARTEAGLQLAMQQLQGRVSARLREARQTVLGVLARIEASIDFPEDDIPTPRADELRPHMLTALRMIDELLAGAEQGRLYRHGLRTVIIGRPNVGKSSLLNALLRSERAIVTPIAGTTRDTVEEVANLRGIPLHLIDTAGITPTDDPVEQIGIQRSRAAAESADLVLLVFDCAEDFTAQDRQVCEELQRLGFGQEGSMTTNGRAGRPVILVLNKIDRPRSLPLEQVRRFWPEAPLVMTSTLTGEGLSQLEETIANLVLAGRALQGDSVLVTNLRHQEALRLASQHLQAALATLEQGLPLDFVSIDLQAACHALGEITGETASADLLERIFSEFCIGK
ncbi:MAG: tRNA uridine-5-carboxymethylaminomethyl(34) synthesis GTPase MnmE [Thermogemmatispora sp.]|uniref:tRNA uridine-5-carboxymethylaminomethyl(34) synthesis GTPase MnmE n=1 Tax=Thermogemmatispora sp. TaxID=1968838 RepID=UPI00260E7C85|nr:tRNA uridine-5-carboxymethylaminomethyl(34) synthesis GTPase MnmE [Thermogemmatispora sp.]MBX5456769.1 tRNA uridine-5-carboxymethylaminomethyl(34) synthesis GTPase MnmE [Thermogemmatispora sp.]